MLLTLPFLSPMSCDEKPSFFLIAFFLSLLFGNRQVDRQANMEKPGFFKNDMFAFLDKSNSIAKPGYNRWFVPPAALAIHLSVSYEWMLFSA